MFAFSVSPNSLAYYSPNSDSSCLIFHGQVRQAQYSLYKLRREQRALAMTDCCVNEYRSLVDLLMQYAYKSKKLLTHAKTAFDKRTRTISHCGSRYPNLAILLQAQAKPLQNHCSARGTFCSVTF